jgi:putative membrane protein
MRKVSSWTLMAFVLAGVSGSVYAVDHGADPAQHAGHGAASTDAAKTQIVLHFLHVANQDEIRAGQKAAEKTRVPEIKEFANRMVKDHTDLDRRLTDAAKKQNIDLSEVGPIGPIRAASKEADLAMEKMLEKKSGPSFDGAYVAHQVEDHQLVMQVILQGAKTAPSGEVKSLLDEAGKTIAAHLADAEHLGEKVQYVPVPPVGGGPGSEPPRR